MLRLQPFYYLKTCAMSLLNATSYRFFALISDTSLTFIIPAILRVRKNHYSTQISDIKKRTMACLKKYSNYKKIIAVTHEKVVTAIAGQKGIRNCEIVEFCL